MDLHFGVIGPGAVGTTIAYELMQSFDLAHVHLFGRQEGSVSYQQRDTHDTAVLHYTPITHFEGHLDVLFIAVKTPQLDQVILQMEHVIDDETIIILAQNGHGQIDKIEHPHVYQAVVYISGQKQDSKVIHYRDRILQLQQDDTTEWLKEELQTTNLELQLKEDIEEYIWYKLLVNLGINSITAVSRHPVAILKSPEARNLCRNLLEEGQRIAAAHEVNLPETIVEDIMKIYTGYPEDMGTSMYYDILAGRPLEVDAIQGYIYQTGQSHGLYTPYLETIFSILKFTKKVN